MGGLKMHSPLRDIRTIFCSYDDVAIWFRSLVVLVVDKFLIKYYKSVRTGS